MSFARRNWLAAVLYAAAFSGAGWAATLGFTIVNDPNGATDTPPFIQLLGINNAGTIVGYTGMGTPNPNRGFILTLPSSFTSLNPNINPTTCTMCQVQVFGISGAGSTTDGFFTDAGGLTHGFVDAGNLATATTVDGPLGVPINTQLLGLDPSAGEAAGFYTDMAGLTHAFDYLVGTSISTELPMGLTNGPIATDNSMATGVNDAGMVVGFDMPSMTLSNGFLYNAGVYTAIQFPGSAFTQPLGLNDNGEVVGDYVDAMGNMHGFYEIGGSYFSFDPPGSAATTANGVNGNGYIVGFFASGNATVGFEAVPTPEPGTMVLGLMAMAVVFVACRSKRRL
jgi:PEP-CTERM motif